MRRGRALRARIALGLALVAGAAALSGCAFRPLYGGGAGGTVATALSSVAVAPIATRSGWLVRNALVDRLAPTGEKPRYRLEAELDDDITAFGIRGDSAATRERRTLRLRYRLVDATDGMVLVDATAGADAGIDVVSSEYATVVAEQSAAERLASQLADQVVARLGLYFRHRGAQPR